MSKLLSICVPTYNRASYLEKGLLAIFRAIQGYENEIEVRVSDNNSQDNTQEVLEKFKKEFPHLIYSKNSQNIGAERNNAKLVAESQGEFIWIVGDDDIVLPNSGKFILERLKMGYNSAIINFINIFPPFDLKGSSIFQFNDLHIQSAHECMEKFKFDLSFISSLILPQKWWKTYYANFIDTGFAHLGVLFSGLMEKCNLAFIKEPVMLHVLGTPSDFGNFSLEYYLIEGVGTLLRAFRSMEYPHQSVSKLANHALYWVIHRFDRLSRWQKLKKIPFARIIQNYGAYSNCWWLVFIEPFLPIAFSQFIRKCRKHLLSVLSFTS